MVLTEGYGSVADGHAPVARPPAAAAHRRHSAQTGSQAIEFALVLPLVGLLLALFVHTGMLLADVLTAQAVAREVARTAAVDGDDAAHEIGRQLAGRRAVRVDLTHADALIEVRIDLRSTAFDSVFRPVWVPARATMRVEGTAAGDQP